MERPNGGGSFIRQKNGSLIKRTEEAEAPPVPPTTQPDPKTRTPRSTTKDR